MDFLFQPEPIRWVQRAFGLGHPAPFRVLSELGTSWGILFAASVALWLFGRRALYRLLALVALEIAARKALSWSFGVPRPTAADVVKYEHVELSSSFPSGHVSTAGAVWTYLGLATRFPLPLGLSLAVAVGVARMYLGVHYLTDVLGGLALGGGLAWGWSRWGERVRAWLGSWGFGVWVGLAVAVIAAAVAVPAFLGGQTRYLWNSAGLACGAAVALPLEHRLVGYGPPAGAAGRTRALGVGAPGVLVPFFGDVAAPGGSLAFGAAMVFLATLWGLLGAPALLVRLGWSSLGTAGPDAGAERRG